MQSSNATHLHLVPGNYACEITLLRSPVCFGDITALVFHFHLAHICFATSDHPRKRGPTPIPTQRLAKSKSHAGLHNGRGSKDPWQVRQVTSKKKGWQLQSHFKLEICSWLFPPVTWAVVGRLVPAPGAGSDAAWQGPAEQLPWQVHPERPSSALRPACDSRGRPAAAGAEQGAACPRTLRTGSTAVTCRQ